ASLLVLPIVPSADWRPLGHELPTWRILGLLAASVGVPYLLLSATAPLLQAWFDRTHRGLSPYRLYALSNAGSLLALLSYPFVFEPALRLRPQATIWSWTYGVFALLCGWCALRTARAEPRRSGEAGSDRAPRATSHGDADTSEAAGGAAPPTPGALAVAYWLALSALGSIMLVATTNQLCQDISVVPLLWVLPLALYLLTFILCFESQRWYSRPLFAALIAVCAPAACLVAREPSTRELWLQTGVYSATLFVACMCCHGELVRSKPRPRHLTLFYLSVAAGGALGGAFVALGAPQLFKDYDEYLLGVAGVCFVSLRSYLRERATARGGGAARLSWVLSILFVLALVAAYELREVMTNRLVVARARNFYGVLRVSEGQNEINGLRYLALTDGQTRHGLQFVDGALRRLGTTYYGPNTGGGLALEHHPARTARGGRHGPLRVGLVGLGAGTLAVHGRQADLFRFYEINPDVIRLAREHFTFLRDSRAQIEVVQGDARIQLERELAGSGSQQFDVLVVDAFTGDAVPAHLLTRECAILYWRHLKPDGLLAIHLSNRHLELTGVARGLARATGHEIAFFRMRADPELARDKTDWVVITNSREFLSTRQVAASRGRWPQPAPEPILWTDDFSSLWQVIRL
ncbi:spermidine synthase, partial [Planctomycetota bacterium]